VASIYIETHGCQMNEADSQYIARRAASAGYTLAEKPEDASVLVLNTCTVRDNAETRAYGRIGQWKALKTVDPGVKVIVAGCLAEADRERMRALVPHVARYIANRPHSSGSRAFRYRRLLRGAMISAMTTSR
jgi:tRNA-2-methylthio-N6-dimethylallyladenosine synthase